MQANITAYTDILHKVRSFYKELGLAEQEPTRGRKLALTVEVTIALGIFKQTHGIVTKKAVYDIFEPNCSYKTFVVNLNRFAYLATLILSLLLYCNKKIAHVVKYTDSTDIPVCLFKNANGHRVMKELATFAGSSHGVFYGLRLHLTVDLRRNALAVKFTTANIDQRDVFPSLNHDMNGIFVADNGYLRPKLQQQFYIPSQRVMLVKPRKNMRKLMTKFQQWLYEGRMQIELNFRNLKLFHGLVTSLPRSVEGYFANYIYALLASCLS